MQTWNIESHNHFLVAQYVVALRCHLLGRLLILFHWHR